MHMEEEQMTPETEVKESKWTHVTPLSKYLAMILFILMPFVGGWIGYHYAPTKVVEVEKIIIEEKEPEQSTVHINNDSIIPLDQDSFSKISKTYVNKKFGYEFKYPSDWHVIYVDSSCKSGTCNSEFSEYTEWSSSSDVWRVIVTDTELEQNTYYNYENISGNEISIEVSTPETVGSHYADATSVDEYWERLGGTGEARVEGVTNNFLSKRAFNGIEMILFEQFNKKKFPEPEGDWTYQALFMIGENFIWARSSYEIDINEFTDFLSSIRLAN